MEFLKLVKEYERMCDSFDGECKKCKLNNYSYSCNETAFSLPEEFAEIVEEWSKEHSKKNNREKFIEIFKKGSWLKHADAGYCNKVCISPNSPCAACPWWEVEYEEKED